MKVYFQNSPKNTVKWKRRGIFSALSSFLRLRSVLRNLLFLSSTGNRNPVGHEGDRNIKNAARSPQLRIKYKEIIP
nr:MAG TPA: hypothetical protein [Caudoviricetes sp.]